MWGDVLMADDSVDVEPPIQLAPFTSDGCSFYPDGTYADTNQWKHCCFDHDVAYWRGGTAEERLEADEALKQCVIETGAVDTAYLMFSGVRVGGSPDMPTEFRWGYGWPFFRDYGPLNADELEQVHKAEIAAGIREAAP